MDAYMTRRVDGRWRVYRQAPGGPVVDTGIAWDTQDAAREYCRRKNVMSLVRTHLEETGRTGLRTVSADGVLGG